MRDRQAGELRPRLFAIAYRVLGSWTEAEDVVQEAWLRWRATDRSTVRNPAAFLATTTTRLALDAATSARARREAYVGPWLPNPSTRAPTRRCAPRPRRRCRPPCCCSSG